MCFFKIYQILTIHFYLMKKKYFLLIIISQLLCPVVLLAQTQVDSIPGDVTLQQCVVFALRNQPAIRQASIDEQINEKDVRIGLSAWLPQVSSSGQYQHYF